MGCSAQGAHSGGHNMAPADADQVLSAIRLGWYVAELRGFANPRGPTPPVAGLVPPSPTLALRNTRDIPALRSEAEAVVRSLTTKLLDASVQGLALHVIDLTSSPAPDPDARWQQVATSIYTLDCRTQDALTASSDTQACGYLFGRGLSECYWSLDCDPAEGNDPPQPTDASWRAVFSAVRTDELIRLSGRLGAYFPPFSAGAVAKTLNVWKAIANPTNANAAWREGRAVNDLYDQVRRWYEVVVLQQDPASLIEPSAVIHDLPSAMRVLWAFLPELLFGGASLGLLAWLVDLLSTPPTSGFFSSAAVKGVIGVASTLGLTGTTVKSRLKNESQSISTRLKQDARRDLISTQLVVAPPKPGVRTNPGQRREIAKAVRAAGIPAAGRSAAEISAAHPPPATPPTPRPSPPEPDVRTPFPATPDGPPRRDQHSHPAAR